MATLRLSHEAGVSAAMLSYLGF